MDSDAKGDLEDKNPDLAKHDAPRYYTNFVAERLKKYFQNKIQMCDGGTDRWMEVIPIEYCDIVSEKESDPCFLLIYSKKHSPLTHPSTPYTNPDPCFRITVRPPNLSLNQGQFRPFSSPSPWDKICVCFDVAAWSC